jgi:hypothetical protein
VDDGFDVVSMATNSSPGIVKGSPDVGKASALSDGTLLVNGWDGKEDKSNKSDVVDNSTDKYPSNKAVWDLTATFENTANKVSELRSPELADNFKYPSEKAVVDALVGYMTTGRMADGLSVAFPEDRVPTVAAVLAALNLKVDRTAAAAVLGPDSTDDQWVTAKAVYDALGLKMDKTSALVERGDVDTSTAIAENYVITVPQYTVGSNRLQLFFMGLLCKSGADKSYVEVGTAGQVSTSVQILFPVPAGSRLEYIIYN